MAKTKSSGKQVKPTAPREPTAKQFLVKLTSLPKPQTATNARYYKGDDKANLILGVRMGALFALAKQYMAMPIREIEKLLDSKYYEARMGAVCIMDFLARNKKTTDDQKKQLYELYIDRHGRINNWDMVDRSAPHVVGGYLYNNDRAPLYHLARSKNPWERRTAIVATWFFIRQNEIDDTFQIAEMLLNDKDEYVQKAVGSWVREAGKRDKQMLLNFLDNHADTMPREMLRYATEKLEKKERERYMG